MADTDPDEYIAYLDNRQRAFWSAVYPILQQYRIDLNIEINVYTPAGTGTARAGSTGSSIELEPFHYEVPKRDRRSVTQDQETNAMPFASAAFNFDTAPDFHFIQKNITHYNKEIEQFSHTYHTDTQTSATYHFVLTSDTLLIIGVVIFLAIIHCPLVMYICT